MTNQSESEVIYYRSEDGKVHHGIHVYPEHRLLCADCGCDVTDEFYMLHKSLWDEYVHADGWYCVPCVEDRIGRRLERADFKLCPINVITFRKTERLLERMGGEPLNPEDLMRDK
jgi:hypothetical protein